jgi:hypothetical protein
MAATGNSEVGPVLLFLAIVLDDLSYGRFGKEKTFL